MLNITAESLELLKKIGMTDALIKSITTGTGLVSFDLQAPAKNLYPVNTPIIKTIPRVGGSGGVATNWRVVSAIAGSGYDSMPWVPEGQRSARMSYTTANKAANYVTIGEEDQVTFEAVSAGRNFEDVRATAAIRLLQKMMLKEEAAVLGGNNSIALGTPTAPTVTASGAGTLPSATYSVIVVALTFEGYRNSSLAGGVATSQLITGADGLTYTLKGGSSQKSGNTTQASGGSNINASTPAVNGAVAYAWYTGTAGSEKLEAITTINSVTFSAPLLGTGQAATAITADNSQNTTLAFDGLLSAAMAPASNAYNVALPTGTAGTGTVLTASGRGSINEIDTMLFTMWNNFQTGPDFLWVNAQEQKNMTNKVLSNASGPLLRYEVSASRPYGIVANGAIEYYYNPYGAANSATPGGGKMIPVIVHPTLPPGTILADCANLPPQYISNNIPTVREVHTRRDYYEIDWPLRTRQYEMGVYAEEVLAVYAPFTLGVLKNIANG